MITFTRNKINFKVHKFNELILSVLSFIVISDKYSLSPLQFDPTKNRINYNPVETMCSHA